MACDLQDLSSNPEKINYLAINYKCILIFSSERTVSAEFSFLLPARNEMSLMILSISALDMHKITLVMSFRNDSCTN